MALEIVEGSNSSACAQLLTVPNLAKVTKMRHAVKSSKRELIGRNPNLKKFNYLGVYIIVRRKLNSLHFAQTSFASLDYSSDQGCVKL